MDSYFYRSFYIDVLHSDVSVSPKKGFQKLNTVRQTQGSPQDFVGYHCMIIYENDLEEALSLALNLDATFTQIKLSL